jgi:ribose transport system substrate-binding protein
MGWFLYLPIGQMTYRLQCLAGSNCDSVNSASAYMRLYLFRIGHRYDSLAVRYVLLAYISLLLCTSCHEPAPVTIAVIPRTSGTLLWEPEHRGAQDAAENMGARIYWNAPTREDDVARQIDLIDQVVAGNYQGLVLTPNQSLSLITPVRRALAHGLPIVIVSSPIPVPAGDKLSYILNDEQEGGRIAARRIAFLLHGRGSIAVLGINPDISGIMTRAHSFEEFMAENYPAIHIVDKHIGSFNVPHEQEVAEETLDAHPDLDAIVALMWPSARGAMSTIDGRPGMFRAKVVGFDPEDVLFNSPSLDSVVLQNTRKMGYLAVQLIHARLMGKPVPPLISLEPTLVTRGNLNTNEVQYMTTMDWRPDWNWSHTR